jgi:hypothetical protein
VCDKHVERWDKILDKIDACTARIRARQAKLLPARQLDMIPLPMSIGWRRSSIF